MTRSSLLAVTRNGLLVVTLAAGTSAWGQSVISAHSGTIHYTEGQVLLDGNAVQPKFGEFPEVKSGQVLSAQDGRAEILLTPGVFLRLGENSSFKMISNQLTNTRLEVQSGMAMIEVGELLPDNAITVVFHAADISIAKRGLYRFNSDPARLRVYEGELSVVSPSTDPMVLRKGHELVFGEAKLEAKTFDPKVTDDFYRWSARRDEYVAEANITSAKSARDSGYSGNCYNGYGNGLGLGSGLNPRLGMVAATDPNSTSTLNCSGMGTGSWAWNPWFGMFTYLPYSGTYFSPFGYGYFSPYAVGAMYGPYSPYAYGNGYLGNTGGIGRAGALSSASSAATPATAVTRAAGFSGGGLSSGGSSSSGRGGSSGGGLASGGGMSGSGGIASGGGHAGGSSGGHH